MFIVAFIPMLLVALAYRDLNRAAPDCGTVFTWGTKAFGPVVGWLGGWGLAVSGIIVLANVAEVAAIYLLLFLGQDELAENPFVKVGLGVVFIALMTWISYRGIVILVLPVRADRLRDRGRGDLVHLPLLGLGFLPCDHRGNQGCGQDSGPGGFAQHSDLAAHLSSRGRCHSRASRRPALAWPTRKTLTKC
jgi:hypothetical protein